MKVSRDWLQKYFAEPLPPGEELSRALMFHAFEIESSEEKEGDSILDIKVTPNRGHDALSHRGIAKELSAIMRMALSSDPLKEKVDLSKRSRELEVQIADSSLCRRYSAAVLKGIEIQESPLWLKKRLESVGQRPINNVVDATNFVMFNIGQPLHAFDAGKLSGEEKRITVRRAKNGEKITSLENKTYELAEPNLLIVDGTSDTPVGIAGVKGGKAAEITGETRSIVIESANFNGVSIRKTAQVLKLRTDASARFEHGLSPELTAFALQSAAELILKIAGGELEGYVDAYPEPQKPWKVSVKLSHINRILGLSLAAGEVEEIFRRLEFEYSLQGEIFTVAPPFERLDLTISEDLIEEIGRIYGYEHIGAVIPGKTEKVEFNKRFFHTDKLREVLIEEGFSEVLTSSFRNKDKIRLLNALASDKGYLRSTLTGNLEDALALNVYNASLLGLDEVRIFEIGTVFDEKGEHTSLAFAVSGKKGGEVIALVKKRIEEVTGTEIQPGEGTLSENMYELNIDSILARLPEPIEYEARPETSKVRYQPFSAYPFVLRDIALWVPKTTTPQDIEAMIRAEAGSLLVHLRLFDRFEKEERISYAFRLVFQSDEKTLSDAEVNALMEKVTKALRAQGFEVR